MVVTSRAAPTKIRAIVIIALMGICSAHGVALADDRSGENHASDLVGRWKFDILDDDHSPDSSGHGNTATIHGGQLGSGYDGRALAMDGGNDNIVTIPMSESLGSTAQGITVMAWTYRTADHNVAVVAHNYPALFFGFHGPKFKWMLRREGEIAMLCLADPGDRNVLGRWIHLAATYDNTMARLYADGIEVCSSPYASALNLSEGPFTISGYLTSEGEIVDEITGKLDDVRIYNRAMAGEEILEQYLKDRERQK